MKENTMSKQEKEAKTVEAEVVEEKKAELTAEELKEMREQLEEMQAKLPDRSYGDFAKDCARDIGVISAAIAVVYALGAGIRALRGNGSSNEETEQGEDNVSYLEEQVA
jgi:hypothetical protein